MMTSCTISQDLRLRHARADARAHAVTDKVASAQDVAAMFLTSLALRLLWRARAWAEETILFISGFSSYCASAARRATFSWQLCSLARSRVSEELAWSSDGPNSNDWFEALEPLLIELPPKWHAS